MIQRNDCSPPSLISHIGNWEGWRIPQPWSQPFDLVRSFVFISPHSDKPTSPTVQTSTLPPTKAGNHFWKHLQGSSQIWPQPPQKTYSSRESLDTSKSAWMILHIRIRWPVSETLSPVCPHLEKQQHKNKLQEKWYADFNPQISLRSFQVSNLLIRKRFERQFFSWSPAVPVIEWDDWVFFRSL